MKYSEFLYIINDVNFDEKVYQNLLNEYGKKLIFGYFSRYINNNNLSEDSYDKCKYYLEDELNNYNDDNLKYKDLSCYNQYLSDIKQYRLLEPEEEKMILVKLDNLKNKINYYKENFDINGLIKLYGKDLNKLEILNLDVALLKKYLKIKKEYDELSNKLIESNLRLVISVAKRYDTPIIDLLDLIQEGNMGIKDAVDKFDINKGNKFSTYAIWWIRQRIVREIHNNSRTIKLPSHKHELLYRIRKLNSIFEKEYNRLPSNEELINYIKLKIEKGELKESKLYDNITPEFLEDLKNISQNIVSINAQVGDDDDCTLENYIVDDEQEGIETIVNKELLKDDIKNIFDELDSKYKLIIILRFGFKLNEYMSYDEFISSFHKKLYSDKYYKELYLNLCKYTGSYTLEQIAKIFGLTRERVRQLEAKALRLIRKKNSFKKVLQPDLLDLYK